MTTHQQILSIDATILSTFQACARKAKYSFIDNLRPPQKAEGLERGDLVHKMLEIYYSLQIKNFDFNTPVWREVLDSGIKAPADLENRKLSSIKDFSITVGRYFSTKMD